MKVGVIAPSKIRFVSEAVKKSEEDVKSMFTEIARIFAKNKAEIVITPDKDSPLEFFGQQYTRLGGKKIYEVLPMDDKEFGYKDWVNVDLGEAINCGIWRNQPEKTNEVTDLLVCIGYGVGVLIEIAYSKWFKPKKVFIIKELVSCELPVEVNRSLDIEYVSMRQLENKIKQWKA